MTNLMNSKYRVSVFALIALLFFVIGQQAISGNWDRRSSTEADSQATCYDCLRQAAMVNSQYEDFRSIKVAIFSANPDGEWVDPRVEMSLVENPQLNAITLVKVSAKLAQPPRGAIGISTAQHDAANGTYTGAGTGFMINECLMVTNHHVSFIDSDEKSVSSQKIEIYQRDRRMDGTLGELSKVAGKVVASGNYTGSNDPNNDWTIVKLENPRQDTAGVIPPCYATEKQAVNLPVSSASIYSDLNSDGKSTWGQKKCQIYGKYSGSRGDWATNCAAIPGVSGSPIFTTNPKTGKLCALGILSAVSDITETKSKAVTNQNFNKMVPFSEALPREKLNQIIQSNPCIQTTRT